MKGKFSVKNVVVISLLILGLAFSASGKEQLFSSLVGNVKVKDVTSSDTWIVPFIIWGGDMATFYANGGLRTKPGSIFAKQGLDIQLVPGDDYIGQVKNYMSGKSPFLRGTFRMAGMSSEVIASDPRTKGNMFLQMTFSQGDHAVSRNNVKSLKDLNGKKVVLQQGGPHVGMFDDMLKTAGLSWDDVTVIWAKDLTATKNSPAELFRNDSSISVCFVVTPDMIGLTGGLQNTGSGAEGTVKGSRVLVSTAELNKSIADIYIARDDFYKANQDKIAKFVAGYLKACEEVIDLKKAYETKGSKEYTKLLQLTQDIYGKEVIPTLDDAHGLLCDCKFVGHPGNVAFFNDQNNLHGFAAFQKSALDLATSRGYANVKAGFIPSKLNYNSAVFTNYLQKTQVVKKNKFHAEAVQSEIEALNSGEVNDRTIYSFTIYFEPDQTEFPIEQYSVEFQKAIEMADKYGGAVMAIRGHSDPTLTLGHMVKAGIKKGILKRSGNKPNHKYSLDGKKLDIKDTQAIINAIQSGKFDGDPKFNPRQTMQVATDLSRKRSENVKKQMAVFAKNQGVQFDESQIQPVGVGIKEPFIARPLTIEEAAENRRVEFALMRVSAEALTDSDFDF